MSAAFYRLRPASSDEEKQKNEHSQAPQPWQAANLPSAVNVDGPAETVNLSKFEVSCHRLEHEVKENIIYQAGLHGMYVSLSVDFVWGLYCILALGFSWYAMAAAAHILVLPWALCAFILHAPRYFTSIKDVLREGCSWTFVPSVWATARTILCLQAAISRESPKYVDFVTALLWAIWALANLYQSTSVCDISWRDHWLQKQVAKMPDQPIFSKWRWAYWKQGIFAFSRSMADCMTKKIRWSVRRVLGAYILLYGITLIVLVCTKNWLKIFCIGALALSPRPNDGIALAYGAFKRPAAIIGGTLQSFIGGVVAILLTTLIVHFFLHQYRAIKDVIKPIQARDLQIALSTPSLLVQMLGFKCIIDGLADVNQHTINLVRNRADAPRARDFQAEAVRPIIPSETAELLLADQMSMMEIVLRRTLTLLAGATVVAEAVGEVLLTLPKDDQSSISPCLREQLKVTLRQIKGSSYERTPRYVALSAILEDKVQAVISERARLIFINELRGLLIAILSTAYAALVAFQTLIRIKHLASRTNSASNTTASSPPTKFLSSQGLANESEGFVREELSRLKCALKRILEIPACPPHSAKIPEFEIACEQFHEALSQRMLEIITCQ